MRTASKALEKYGHALVSPIAGKLAGQDSVKLKASTRS